MKEYIDREATLNERPEGRNPGQVGKEEYNKGWNDCRSAFYKCITSMPAADVVEVRHGRWIVSELNLGYCDIIQKEYIAKKYICSECGYETGDQANKFACCPICMARMDKEDFELSSW